MKAKFQEGDMVRLGQRCPVDIRQRRRGRTRRIVKAWYDAVDQCRYYELGDRGKATLGYLFRSYMLIPVTDGEIKQVGRPHKTPIKHAK